MTIQQWDERVLLAFNSLLGKSAVVDQIVNLIAVYTIYTVPIILIVLWFYKVREASIRAVLAGAFTWHAVSSLIAEAWFRPRPSLAELGGQELLFHRPTYSFPSDHAGFLAALTVTFYLNGYRKIAAAFLVLTLLVSIARIVVGFHYLTDILGGWLIGAAVALLVHRYRDFIDRSLSRPLIRLAQQVGLA